LAALGTETEDEVQQIRAVAGAMELATGLFELTKLRKLVQKALK